MFKRARFPEWLFAIYVIVWSALAIAPLYREDWLLENLLVFVCVPSVVIAHRRRAFSARACFGMFVFLVLHAIGSHYTYSEVPYRAWWHTLTGQTVDAALRNHYDRFVHFMYGLTMSPAIVEMITRRAPSKTPRWSLVLALSFVMAQALVYELFEWGAAVLFGGDLGAAFLGAQGDPWDAQKDMFLASLGALITLAILRVAHRLPPEQNV